ncbi:MAG: hypothetical protein M3282_12970, partial [Gemmatimonadota bacterium]|nr:hypothetical protein [Gemmatimonadota bacterium]
KPMIALGFVWLVLMIIELTAGLSPFLERLGYVIWALFVADFLLATYGFAIFGYVTATIASVFVARDAESDAGELAGARQLELLRQEIVALRREFGEVAARLGAPDGYRHDAQS